MELNGYREGFVLNAYYFTIVLRNTNGKFILAPTVFEAILSFFQKITTLVIVTAEILYSSSSSPDNWELRVLRKFIIEHLAAKFWFTDSLI